MQGWICLTLLPAIVIAQGSTQISNELPALAAERLAKSLAASTAHRHHVWRDTPPTNDDGTVNAYVEIGRGDQRKWEFDMAANALAIDRVIPDEIGGYPVNYGFVPQTISYDGDPFDVLVLGPPIPEGRLVRGRIVGLLFMEDEKGFDAKVVVSPVAEGPSRIELTEQDKQDISDYFQRYKRLEPDKYSKVPGWGTIADGLALIKMTHTFFEKCRDAPAGSCRVTSGVTRDR